LQRQLNNKQVDLTITNEAKTWLGQKGYDRAMGARPMSRMIQEQIKRPIANELLFGQLQQGGKVKISLKDDKLNFVYSPK